MQFGVFLPQRTPKYCITSEGVEMCPRKLARRPTRARNSFASAEANEETHSSVWGSIRVPCFDFPHFSSHISGNTFLGVVCCGPKLIIIIIYKSDWGTEVLLRTEEQTGKLDWLYTVSEHLWDIFYQNREAGYVAFLAVANKMEIDNFSKAD